jgi:hypothetical protein
MRAMTREEAIQRAEAEFEELSQHPSPNLIKELRGRDAVSIAAALSRAIQRRADEIMLERTS